MSRGAKVRRWVGRRGGLVALPVAAAAYGLSGFYAVSIELTRHEHIGFVCGMCQVAWRTKLAADPTVFGPPGIYANEVTSNAWMTQFSTGRLKDHQYIWFPMWLLIAGAALWAGGGLLYPKPKPPGLCRTCGYDLTGLVGRPCPECGRVGRRGSTA